MSTPVSNSNFLRSLPLFVPALKKDSYDVDHDLILSRTLKVALSALALFAAFILLTQAYHLVPLLPLAILPAIGLACIDGWLTGRAADAMAVKEFLTAPFPSQKAAFRIIHRVQAVDLLVRSKGADVNKLDEQGNNLLVFTANFEIFKRLIDHGADLKQKNSYGSLLQQWVVEKDSTFLEYALEKNKGIAKEFSPDQHANAWAHIGSRKTGLLLALHGFNVNARDRFGFTPLHRLVQRASDTSPFAQLYGGNLTDVEHITILLECGADKTLTAECGGVQKNALQMNEEPGIRAILEQG